MILKNLDGASRRLCAMGIWSLFSVKNNIAKYVMTTSPKTQCCNPHGEQKHYLLNEDGNVIGMAQCSSEYEIEHPIGYNQLMNG